MIRILRTFWPSLLVLGVIVYATWLPGHLEPSGLPTFKHADKLIHAIMFGGLCGAIQFDWYRARPRSGRLTAACIAVIAAGTVVLAAIDESVQGLLPIGRPSDWADFGADTIGILVGALTGRPVIRSIIKPKQS